MPSPTIIQNTARALVRHSRLVVSVFAILGALSIWAAFNTPIYTSRRALLPQDADVSQRLNNFLKKFGAASDLIAVLEGAPRETMEAFAADLAVRLGSRPGIRQVTEKIDLLFFFEHAYLLVPTSKLSQFVSILKKLIGVPAPADLSNWGVAAGRVEKWLESPPPLSTVDVDLQTAEGSINLLQFFLDEWLRWIEAPQAPSSFAWDVLLDRYAKGSSLKNRGFFASRDGRMMFVFITPTSPSEEMDVVIPFIEEVKNTTEALRADYQKQGRQAPTLGLTGLPAVAYEEYTTLQRDILLTIVLSGVSILLLVIFWLGSLRWAMIVFIPMATGVLLSMGLTYLTTGHLTMITAGFTAILFGLGVDYGIFLSYRIQEERAKGGSLEEAIANGCAGAAKAVWTAGSAAVLIFLALANVKLSGYAELGVVAANGVITVLLCTFLLQPVLFHLLSPEPPPRKLAVENEASSDADATSGLPRWASGLIILVALLACGVGIWAAPRIEFDYDVLSLLPKKSQVAAYQRRMVAESDFQGEVIILTASSLEQARHMATSAAKLPSISQVQTVVDLFPRDSGVKLRLARQLGSVVASSEYLSRIFALGQARFPPDTLERIGASLDKATSLFEEAQEMAFSAGHKQLVVLIEKLLVSTQEIRAKLDEKPERAFLRTEHLFHSLINMAKDSFELIGTWRNASELTPDSLPPALKSRFISPDGDMAIYLFPAKSVYVPANLTQLLKDVYSVSPQATGFPTTHQVFSGMAFQSFREGTLWAVVACALWILFLFKNFQGFFFALLPMVVGGSWMFCCLYLLGMKFNYANLIALPLVMGLAVDYGVWFSHRHLELGHRSPWSVARIAGRAIGLAACTTLFGVLAIAFARYRGMASMGIAVTIGLCCCLTATLLVSPAVAHVFFRRRP